ncbi:MAG TPA: hypothetical protein DCO65_03780 [Spartobacteria bacterium]|jgi:hypothetical protein|nr:hypothetical protein [Spartobacteria bacterium]
MNPPSVAAATFGATGDEEVAKKKQTSNSESFREQALKPNIQRRTKNSVGQISFEIAAEDFYFT